MKWKYASRRRVLGLVAAGSIASLAGCISPGGALSMTPVETDAEIGTAATSTIDPNRQPDVAALLENALADGTADVDGERPPFDPDRPIGWRGTVYDVSWDITGQRTRMDYLVVARLAESDMAGSSIAYEELPEVDRTRLADLREIIARSDELEEDERTGTRIQYANDAAIDESVLVPNPEYDLVRIDERFITVETTQTDTTVSTFTYELSERTNSIGTYGTELRTERLLVLESLSDEERDLVEEAINDGQVVVGRDDVAFIALGERLLDHEPIYVNDRVGEWLVEYDDSLYWTELDTLRTTELVERLDEYERD